MNGRWIGWAICVAATALGLVLRLWDLDRFSPWFDEMLCIFQSERLGPLVDGSALSNNPPLFYILLHFWGLASRSAWFLRLLPALAGAAAVPLLFVLGRRLAGNWAGGAAAALLAVSPLHIYYSQEIKMYSLAGTLYVLGLIITHRLLTKPGLGFAAALGGVWAVMLYTHYYLFMAVFIMNAAVLAGLGRRAFRWLIMADLTALVLFAPWLHVYFGRHLDLTIGYVSAWIPRPEVQHIFYTFKNFLIGFHADNGVYWSAVMIGAPLLVAGVVGALHLPRKDAAVLLVGAFTAQPAIFLISQVRPLYLDRYFLFTLPLFLLVIATGLRELPRMGRWACLAGLMLLALITLPAVYSSKIPYPRHIPGEPERLQIREAVDFLRQTMATDDLLFHISRRTNLSFEFEWPERGEQHLWAPWVYAKFPRPEQWFHSELIPELIQDHVNEGDRAWVVLVNWPDDPNDPLIIAVRKWLEERAILLRRESRFTPMLLEYYQFGPMTEQGRAD